MRKFTVGRPSNERDRLALKAAFRQLVAAAGGQEAAAAVTRVAQTSISRYGAAHEGEFLPPIDVVLDLEMDVGAALVTAAMARLTNHLVLADGGDGLPAGLPWMVHLDNLVSELNDVEHGFAHALADGRIDAAEAQRLDKEASEAISALTRFVGDLRRLVAAGGARDEEGGR